MHRKPLWSLALSVSLIFVMSIAAMVLAQSQLAPKAGQSTSPPAKTEPKDTPSQDEMNATMSDMNGMDHSKMNSSAGKPGQAEHHHMNGPHMKMSSMRMEKSGDRDRAEHVLGEVTLAMAQWKDWHNAIRDGFQIFMPNVEQPEYHFTNYKFALENEFRFNPSHPTSLLYKKTGPDSYELVGAMFTAPKRFSEDRINERVPLSVTQWHQHINFCQAPKGQEADYRNKSARFGLQGSIVTKEECDAAGGTFKPILFNWMVHVYPYAASQDAIWAREPKMNNMPGMDHSH